ncbi:MAG TPA: aminotransferase class III-fold pyridoxal phosphate-dependent enzyme, partial [Gemmatimonadales bacterium]|nr:aminotransferase class III-fold pyridoxal phosphate-dependent enzyme [Gemmatimonadales bacterium]
AGRAGKHKILAFMPSYHGNTLLALSASSRESNRALFREWLVEVVRVPAPYPYRCGCGGKAPLCASCSGDAIEQTILREGPGTIAALIGEPVGGSSTGASLPPQPFWRRVRELCDQYEILLLADEVLSGAGRTGTWSALEPYGVVPDLMLVGKGIAGGYAPLSAVVAPRRLVDVLAKGSGSFLHGQTFSHHATLCAAGTATLRYLRQHRLVERCAEMGPVLQQRLEQLREYPLVGDIRGRGLLAGIEFVADRKSRRPYDPSLRVAERFAGAAMDSGVMVWPNAGQLEDGTGDLALLAPPYVIDEDQIEELVLGLSRALDRTASDLRSG